jgi:predicted signal transduction protein with EAL and GGDEF domain
VTASVGIALYPEHGLAPDALISHADAAMYAAKQAGGNRSHAHPGDDAAARSAIERIEGGPSRRRT